MKELKNKCPLKPPKEDERIPLKNCKMPSLLYVIIEEILEKYKQNKEK